MNAVVLIASLCLSSWAHPHEHGPDCIHNEGQRPVGLPEVEGEAPWAGIPLSALADLGLDEPQLDTHRSGWRASLPDDGQVQLLHYADTKQAALGFSMQKLSGSGRGLSPLLWEHSPERDVEAIGDNAGKLVMRDGNLVLVVSDPRLRAGELTQALQAAMVTEAPEGEPVERDLGSRVARWDSCGRLLD